MRTSAVALLLLGAVLGGCTPAAIVPGPALHAAPAATGAPATAVPVNDLWIDVSIGSPLVEWFDRIAEPEDVARVEHPSQVGTIEPIENGRKLVVFKSIRDARRGIEVMGDLFDIIGYNLESGPATPPDEQANPVEAVRAMRELAQQSNKLLAIGPDRNFALNYGPQIAPYVDIFVIQVQRIQTEPDLVRAYVLPLAEALRSANPDIQITAQVRTEGDVVALVDMIESLDGALDGVSILTSPETTDIAEALVAELRSRSPQPTASPTAAPPAQTPSLEPTASPSTTPTSSPAPAALGASATPRPPTSPTLPTPPPPTQVAPVTSVSRGTAALLAGTLLIGVGAGALLVAVGLRAGRRT